MKCSWCVCCDTQTAGWSQWISRSTLQINENLSNYLFTYSIVWIVILQISNFWNKCGQDKVSETDVQFSPFWWRLRLQKRSFGKVLQFFLETSQTLPKMINFHFVILATRGFNFRSGFELSHRKVGEGIPVTFCFSVNECVIITFDVSFFLSRDNKLR